MCLKLVSDNKIRRYVCKVVKFVCISQGTKVNIIYLAAFAQSQDTSTREIFLGQACYTCNPISWIDQAVLEGLTDSTNTICISLS